MPESSRSFLTDPGSLPEHFVTGSLDGGGKIHLFPAELGRTAWADAGHLWSSRFLIRSLVSSRIQVLYQRNVLGFLWTLLNPILMLVVLYVGFSHLLGQETHNFAIYVFSGQMPYLFFSAAILSGSSSLIASEPVIRKIGTSGLCFPLAAVLVEGLNLMFATAALFLMLQPLGAEFTIQLVVVPAAVVLIVAFAFGLSLIGMTLVTYFRDFQHIIPVLLQALWFLSPIFLRAEQLGRFSVIVAANPLTYHIALFRSGLYYGAWPSTELWLVAVGSTAAALIGGYAVFKRHEDDYIFRL